MSTKNWPWDSSWAEVHKLISKDDLRSSDIDCLDVHVVSRHSVEAVKQ